MAEDLGSDDASVSWNELSHRRPLLSRLRSKLGCNANWVLTYSDVRLLCGRASRDLSEPLQLRRQPSLVATRATVPRSGPDGTDAANRRGASQNAGSPPDLQTREW